MNNLGKKEFWIGAIAAVVALVVYNKFIAPRMGGE